MFKNKVKSIVEKIKNKIDKRIWASFYPENNSLVFFIDNVILYNIKLDTIDIFISEDFIFKEVYRRYAALKNLSFREENKIGRFSPKRGSLIFK